ncbi:MAG: LPS-assembly protein LptD [Wolinella sp.]
MGIKSKIAKPRAFAIGIFTAVLLMSECAWGRASIERFDSAQNKVFEFLADNMDAKDTTLFGKGNVTLINLDYYITANSARYDMESGEIELNGNVNVFKGNALYLKSQNVKVELNGDYAFLEPFYLQDSSTGMWISSSQAEFSEETYRVGESILSTCNASQPIWHIEMSEGFYDTTDEWMKLWDSRLYFYRYPIFYTPYLSFSAGYKRKTGLLYPSLSHSNDDGFSYTQPIFIAPEDTWDMTVTPQIRTMRGKGVFSEFRLADDKNSVLWINGGTFRNTDFYKDKHDLKNRTHIGYQMRYHRHSLLANYFDYFDEDGLYIDFTHLNDIDYLRLQKNGEDGVDIRDRLLTSRLSYYLKGERDYIGFYAKYYIDLAKANNDTTLQTLPTLHYHRRTSPLFVENLTYSFDYKAKNLTRKEGYEAIQHELDIPFRYTIPLVNDYFALSFGTNLYATKVNYRSVAHSLDDFIDNGKFYSNYYIATINSDLARFYGDMLHTLHLEASYITPGAKERHGDFTDVLILPGASEEIALKMSQYFYTDSRLRLYHQLEQSFYLDDYDYKYGELENELRYYISNNWSLSSSLIYSHEEEKIAETSHDIEYTEDYFSAYLGHFFRERKLRRKEGGNRFLEANFIRAGFRKEFEEVTLFADAGYDYTEDYFRRWSVGISKDVKCFSYTLRFVNEIRPVLTTTGAKPTEDRYVMFEFRFIPVMSARIKHEQ